MIPPSHHPSLTCKVNAPLAHGWVVGPPHFDPKGQLEPLEPKLPLEAHEVVWMIPPPVCSPVRETLFSKEVRAQADGVTKCALTKQVVG